MAFRALLLAALIALAALSLGWHYGWRQGALWLLGAALGIALFHATFGFAGAFRRLIAERRAAGFRAQLLLLGLAVLLFFPALSAGSVLGQPVRGFVFPAGLAVLLGAFLFGIGMQLGGGCASGTLYTAGGGSPRMWLTLGGFVTGATLAAWQAETWQGWPALPPISLPTLLGLWPALVLSLLVFATAWLLSALVESRRHGQPERFAWQAPPRNLLTGPWPLAWGAIALALLSFATLLLAGRPWAITAAFPLWGSRVVEALGWDDPAFWSYWDDPTRTEALLRPILADRTTVMDLGVMAGALLAATMAGLAARPRWPGLRLAIISLAGGLLLGIGAVLAQGCNISAYLGGVASGSLHGWAWIGPALLGNWVGLRLAAAAGLAPKQDFIPPRQRPAIVTAGDIAR